MNDEFSSKAAVMRKQSLSHELKIITGYLNEINVIQLSRIDLKVLPVSCPTVPGSHYSCEVLTVVGVQVCRRSKPARGISQGGTGTLITSTLQEKEQIYINDASDISMMTSSNGNIFRVTGPLCGEFTGHRWIPRTKASDAELWCFHLICAWINDWGNNREAGDLRRHSAHYDVTIIRERNTHNVYCAEERKYTLKYPMENLRSELLKLKGFKQIFLAINA